MAITDEELREFEITFQAFKSAMGDAFAPYATEAVVENNLKTMCEWSVANLPGGIAAASNIGFFELAFVNCVSKLTRDPNYVSRVERRAALQKEFDSMPAYESRLRYENDPEFKRFVDGGNR